MFGVKTILGIFAKAYKYIIYKMNTYSGNKILAEASKTREAHRKKITEILRDPPVFQIWSSMGYEKTDDYEHADDIMFWRYLMSNLGILIPCYCSFFTNDQRICNIYKSQHDGSRIVNCCSVQALKKVKKNEDTLRI